MIKKHKNKIIVVSLMALGVALILISSLKGKISVKNDSEISESEYEKALELFRINKNGILHNAVNDAHNTMLLFMTILNIYLIMVLREIIYKTI